MVATFSERDVHQFVHARGLEALVKDCTQLDVERCKPAYALNGNGEDFALWRIIKARAVGKLERIHNSVRYGTFVGSKVKLPTNHTTPMELDLLGFHEDGHFVLELKVDRAAERNAFSELFAYSNYIAGIFALSGRKDITNVLVAGIDNKITKQAFLYDLLIADRDIVVYLPVFADGTLESLQLDLFLPSDDDFRHFTNELLSHDAMACVVISFEDMVGWFDSEESDDGSLNDWTRKHLAALSGYAAQLMEAEGLHGFCFIRKSWKSIPRYYRNSLFVCAINPFRIAQPGQGEAILSQLKEEDRGAFREYAEMAFDGRLIRLAQRAVEDCLTHRHSAEVETAYWAAIVTDMQEVVFTHNFGFRPTGMMREAYVAHLNAIYARNAAGEGWTEDVSLLKSNEVNNWVRAWTFMESSGFKDGGESTEDEDDEV